MDGRLPDLVELALALMLTSCALLAPATGSRIFTRLRVLALPLARRPRLLVLLSGLIPIVIRLALLPIVPVPLPRTMEEHNHLLQADTYTHWRLANPPHPLGALFHSFQTIQWPTYVSSRPPLSSLFFFLGDLLFHSPFLGNLLGVGILAACFSWLLLGWTSRMWAVLGSFLVICHLCIFGWWTDSFWAPIVTILGGVILLGLVSRIQRKPKLVHALGFTIGTALIAGTRPYEGFFYVAAIAVFLLIRICSKSQRSELPHTLRAFVIPAIVGCILIAAGQIHYNQATTGHAGMMPYQIWRESQTAVSSFLWQPILPKTQHLYYTADIAFRDWEVASAAMLHGHPLTTLDILIGRHSSSLRDIIGPMLFLPFLCAPVLAGATRIRPSRRALIALALPLPFIALIVWSFPGRKLLLCAALLNLESLLFLIWRWKERSLRFPLLLVFLGALITSASTFYMNNYFLPYVGAVILLVVTGLRNLSSWDKTRHTGAALSGFLFLGCLLMPLLEIGAAVAKHPLYSGSDMGRFDYAPDKTPAEAAALPQFASGRHLVMVRPWGERARNSTLDLVWNSADPDSQRIVWARDLRPDWTAAAHAYYPDRTMWVLDVSDDSSILQPYPINELTTPAPLASLPNPDKEIVLRHAGRAVEPAIANPTLSASPPSPSRPSAAPASSLNVHSTYVRRDTHAPAPVSRPPSSESATQSEPNP